jgi:hypothetical protein
MRAVRESHGARTLLCSDYLRFARVSPSLEPPAWIVRGLPGVGSMSFMLRVRKVVIRDDGACLEPVIPTRGSRMSYCSRQLVVCLMCVFSVLVLDAT